MQGPTRPNQPGCLGHRLWVNRSGVATWQGLRVRATMDPSPLERLPMNFIFVSPQFPHCFWHFCDRLHALGVNVLGIGDSPYDSLDPALKGALTEYYYVSDLEDYDQVFRATAYLSWKHGKIDWIESNNEYWLRSDARLREDFNITTGPNLETVAKLTSKARMKEFYAAAGVPSARQARPANLDELKWFAGEMGYPVVVKPEVGMGAANTYRFDSEAELIEQFGDGIAPGYVLEEFVEGSIVSYDAIVGPTGDILFESCTRFPPSMMDVVKRQLDLWYCVMPEVPEKLRSVGRRTVEAFGITSRFVHLEFFELAHDRFGLGAQGDLVGLEVNARPIGGDAPEMINWAHNTDVYEIWAEMVAYGERRLPKSDVHAYCVYAGRRACHSYAHATQELLERYGDRLMSHGTNAPALALDMGDEFFVARMDDEDSAQEFVAFVQEQAGE